MPQDYVDRRKPGRSVLKCAPLMRIACGAALAGLAICAGTAMAYAGDDDTISSSTSFYDKFLQTIGVEGGGANIEYSERSPLVVPPTRDLPPPAADRAAAGTGLAQGSGHRAARASQGQGKAPI